MYNLLPDTKPFLWRCFVLAVLGGCLFLGLPATGLARTEPTDAPRPVEAMKIAVDAYGYGYPLVTFDKVRQQNTNVASPDAEHAPVGQMIKMRSYPAVDNHCCAAPNSDTLYTMVWLDVSDEPWIIKVPAMGERYYILPFLDGWSEVFHVASQPLSGGGAQTYAVTGPGWSGTLPQGVIELYLQAKSPGKAKEPNWLPAPEGKFKLVLRLYDPSSKDPGILDGSWTPPAVKRVE